MLTPNYAPQANGICERFWGNLRRECLDFFIVLGEFHLYRIMKKYVDNARSHQGIDQRIPGKLEPSTGEGISRLPGARRPAS
jgi:transposase InsO family protein